MKQILTTIKAPIPSHIKVRIIYPSLALWSYEKRSNLTSEGTRPAPHRCSLLGLLFLSFVQVIHSSDRIVQLTGGILRPHQLASSVGNCLARLIASRTQELHGTHTLNGYHQQHSRRQATVIHRPRETGSNPHDHSGVSHETEPRSGGTATSERCRTQCSRGQPGRQFRTRGTRAARGQ